jgi:hypothetical protein
MHSPIPGPFAGSIPSPDLAGAQHARLLDASFSALGILAAGGVWAGAHLSGQQADVVAVAKVSCAVLLVTALTGMWMIERSAEMPRLWVTVFVEAMRRRMDMRSLQRAVALSPRETPARGVAGLLEGFSGWLDRVGEPAYKAQTDALIADRRSEAQRLVAALYREADTLSDTSNDIEDSGRRLLGDLGSAEGACNQTQSALSRLTDRVAALTAAVSTTTSQVDQVKTVSVALSELAFASQRKMVTLDERAASLTVDIEGVGRLLGRVGGLTEAAYITGSHLGEPGTPVVTLALELRDLAALALTTLAGIGASLAEMTSQAAAAARTGQDIDARVQVQHELGLGLSQAVLQQAAEIAEIIRMIDEAQQGFLTLRASVEAVTRHGLSRSVQSAKLRAAAARLPAHADSVADVLRGIPDFAPPIEFEF